MTEYESESFECRHCGEFVVTIAPFITSDFEVSFCPNCGTELPERETE